MFRPHSLTSVAVDCIDFERIVAAVAAAVEQELVLGGVDSGFALLLVEDEREVVLQVVDYHRIGRIEYHLGAVDRS